MARPKTAYHKVTRQGGIPSAHQLTLNQGDYLGLSQWIQCNPQRSLKVEEGQSFSLG